MVITISITIRVNNDIKLRTILTTIIIFDYDNFSSKLNFWLLLVLLHVGVDFYLVL